jgi:hypothetical protein
MFALMNLNQTINIRVYKKVLYEKSWLIKIAVVVD